MQAIKEANGNVTFRLEGDDGEQLKSFQAQVQKNRDHDVLSSMLDYFGFMGNAQYIPILPEDIGALTDAPMFTDELQLQDDGSRDVVGAVWWYPAYETRDFGEELLTAGQVTFTLAKG